MKKISWHLLMISLLIGSTACRGIDSKYATIDEVVAAFNAAGFNGGLLRPENLNEVLGLYSQFVNDGRAVDFALFDSERHPCGLIQFDSAESASRYWRHPVVQNATHFRASRKAVTRSGPFILFFDQPFNISTELIAIFSQ